MPEHILDIQAFRERFSYNPNTDLILVEKQSKVYQAKDNQSGELVALRLYEGQDISHRMFSSEAEQTLSQRHPNLVSYLDYYIVKTTNFFGEESAILVSVQEYVSGMMFRPWMEKRPHGKEELDDMLSGILKGLRYLHGEGITHGSLRPTNILLQRIDNDRFEPKLINYGFTKLFDATKTSSGGLLVGSSEYMPPEKIVSLPTSRLRVNSDLWNFGVLLYEIFLGKSPFGSKKEGLNLGQIFERILNQPVPDDISILPEPYRGIASGCLVKNPEVRTASADAILDILQPPKVEAAVPPPVVEKKILHHARVIFLGDAKVGKTSMIRALIGQDFDEKEEMTRGIEITPYEFPLDDDEKVQAKVWDFGGQEIMQSTHQFFLSRRSVYVLVWDARRDDEKGQIMDWLELVHSFGGDSPVIIVVNQCDVREYQLNESRIRSKFPQVRSFLSTSCKTGKGIEQLQEMVKETIGGLSHIKESWPDTWLAVKDELESLSDNFVEFGTYRKLCQKHGVPMEEQEDLIQLLHDLGLLLNFRDDAMLQGTSILRPDWVTRGVYSIINDPRLHRQKGVISHQDLQEILDPEEFPPEKHIVLIGLMRKFQLCFPVGDQQEFYLLPASLPVEAPEYNWDNRENLIFQYQYNFLPKSIFPSFIVKMHSYTDGSLIWRDGIVLYLIEEETRAEVVLDVREKRIQLRIKGKAPGKALFLIRRKFAEIHANFPRLQVKEQVPCNCEVCIEEDAPHLFDYKTLLKFKENKRNKITCNISVLDVPIAQLTREIIDIAPKKEKIAEPTPPVAPVNRNDLTGFITETSLLKNIDKILFLASNPAAEEADFRLHREHREIDEGLRRSRKRMAFRLKERFAVRAQDFRRALLEEEPRFVHFSGHGGESTGLVFEDNNGQPQAVAGGALAAIMELFPSINCVFFNGCFAPGQANALSAVVPYVIGLPGPVDDLAAVTFAVGFYDAISAGKEIPYAFKFAASAMKLEGFADVEPVLIKKKA